MTRTPPNLSPQIVEEASDWFVEFSEGNLDTSARERFDTWLRRSPEHVQAYLKIAALWEDAPMLEKGRVLPSNELVARVLAEGNIIPLGAGDTSSKDRVVSREPLRAPAVEERPPDATAASHELPTLPVRERNSGRRIRLYAIAASVLCAVVAGTWIYVQRGTYSTATGEQRSVRLEDGSTLELNSQSKVRVRFTEHQRNIELIEGQALFRVAKDAARPFIVATDNTHVRAVGTQFDVYRKSSGTVVTVLEGHVAVLSDQAGSAQPEAEASSQRSSGERPPPEKALALPKTAKHSVPALSAPEVPSADESTHENVPAVLTPRDGEILLAAGEQLTVTPTATSQPKPADIAVATAWTQGKITFRATPLSDVVEEFNRYNTRQLVIADPTLKDTKISGVFSSTDPDSLLRFLRELPNIDVQEAHNEIRISRK